MPLLRSDLTSHTFVNLPLLLGYRIPVLQRAVVPPSHSKYLYEQRYWLHALKLNGKHFVKHERVAKALTSIIVDYGLDSADICRPAPTGPTSATMPIVLSSAGLLSWLCRRAEMSNRARDVHQHYVQRWGWSHSVLLHLRDTGCCDPFGERGSVAIDHSRTQCPRVLCQRLCEDRWAHRVLANAARCVDRAQGAYVLDSVAALV